MQICIEVILRFCYNTYVNITLDKYSDFILIVNYFLSYIVLATSMSKHFTKSRHGQYIPKTEKKLHKEAKY